MKTKKEKTDVYEMINIMILEKLAQGTMPWKKTWNSFGPARNYVTGKPYRGFNALIMGMIGANFDYPIFLTFNQAKQLGGFVKNGSKGFPVIFWKKLYFSEETSKRIMPNELKDHNPDDIKAVPLLRYYKVFNINSIEGVEFNLPGGNYVNNPIERCENIILDMPNRPALVKGGDQPKYNSVKDVIKVPDIKDFTSEEEFYAALFHELSHATGHASRLDRETLTKPAVFGSKIYCQEELVAEIATCFLCNEAGIMNDIIDNSAAYIKHWYDRLSEILKKDKRFFIKASAEAQKAADYILNRLEGSHQENSLAFEKVEGEGI